MDGEATVAEILSLVGVFQGLGQFTQFTVEDIAGVLFGFFGGVGVAEIGFVASCLLTCRHFRSMRFQVSVFD
jgi:hypothetical protein